MKPGKLKDLLLNVMLPLFAGCSLYFTEQKMPGFLPGIIRNYLSDGLWAYAFQSTILIIWNRQLKVIPAILTLLVAAIFEMLQHFGLLNGTGDLYDMLTYALFISIALILNKFFIIKFYQTKLNYEFD